MKAASRRSWLRAVALGTFGLLVGCAGPPRTASNEANGSEQAMDVKPEWTQNDIESGMNSIGPALMACYQNALKVNRKESGSITISAAIAKDGHVESATPVASSLSVELGQCLSGVVKAAHFRAPGVDGVRLKIPLAFEQENDNKDPKKE